MAQVHFTYGAMGSGKSLNVMNMANELTRHGLDFTLAKPAVDTKADRAIRSRLLPDDMMVDILVGQEQNIRELIKQEMGRRGLDTLVRVLVDEAQFLEPDQVDQLLDVALIDEIEVRAFGLKTDFQTNFFPGSRRLFEIAHQMTELETTCRCGGYATNNTRKVNGVFVFSGSQVAIDGEDVQYEALCRKCYSTERGAAGAA